MTKLTPAQERFVRELITGKTQRQAYYEAYPKSKKWKPESVDCNAAQLFADAKVSQRYTELQQAAAERAGITAERIMDEFAKVGLLDLDDPKVQDGLVRVSDKLKALELAGRKLGMFTDKVQADVHMDTGKLDEVIARLRGG